MLSGLIDAAEKAGMVYTVDIYLCYGSGTDAALDAGADARHRLTGPSVFAFQGYEKLHRDGAKNTFSLLKSYLR